MKRIAAVRKARPAGVRFTRLGTPAAARIKQLRATQRPIDYPSRQERFEVGFRHVRLDQPRSCRDLCGAAGGQVVHDDDPVSVRDVASRHVRADEARTARHHDVHRLVA